jgi:sugar phosphate isomerase/epimerase
MKSLFFAFLVCLTASLHAQTTDFHDHLGIQLWSLRAQFPKAITSTMDLISKTYGIKEVETAGTYGMNPSQFSSDLSSHGLSAISSHYGYDLFVKEFPVIVRNLKALGIHYVVIPVLGHPHSKYLTAVQAHEDAANLNKWGAALKAEGIQLGVHTHGFEFTPLPDSNNETGLDIVMRETMPNLVFFEMDVFWVYAGGADPVALLRKYPDRWLMLHVKDLRKGADRADGVPSHTKLGDDVAVGAGVIDWKAVLTAAQNDGVKYYFIEDETTDPLKNIPLSLAYLKALKL